MLRRSQRCDEVQRCDEAAALHDDSGQRSELTISHRIMKSSVMGRDHLGGQ